MAEVIALAKPSDCCSLAFRGQVCEVALLLTKLHQKAPHDFLCHQQSAEAAVKGEGQSAKPFLATCGCVWYLAASGSTAPPALPRAVDGLLSAQQWPAAVEGRGR